MAGIKMKVVCLLLGSFLSYSGGLALADDRDRNGDIKKDTTRDVTRDVRSHRHYYHNGRWYRKGWFGFGIAVPALSVGAFVDFLPATYTGVAVQGRVYYYGDNTYFMPLPEGGYLVVAPPSN
jgi:hypothetical protein